jgi:hypothetical protein
MCPIDDQYARRSKPHVRGMTVSPPARGGSDHSPGEGHSARGPWEAGVTLVVGRARRRREGCQGLSEIRIQISDSRRQGVAPNVSKRLDCEWIAGRASQAAVIKPVANSVPDTEPAQPKDTYPYLVERSLAAKPYGPSREGQGPSVAAFVRPSMRFYVTCFRSAVDVPTCRRPVGR